MSDRQGVEIDCCPQCRGVWQERRELDKLIERSAATAPTPANREAARFVALTVVADGDFADAEIEWLDRLAVHEQFGIARHELNALPDKF